MPLIYQSAVDIECLFIFEYRLIVGNIDKNHAALLKITEKNLV